MTTQACHTPAIKPSRPRDCIGRGFTLGEALVASVFLSIAVLGVSSTLTAASSEAKFSTHGANCQSLARELIEEIGSKSFTSQPNPGYSAGTRDRSTYDDIADYAGYTDSTTDIGGMKTLQGTAIDFGDGATYTRTVAFEFRATPGGAAAASGDFAMATINVRSNGGASVTLQRLLSNSPVKRT